MLKKKDLERKQLEAAAVRRGRQGRRIKRGQPTGKGYDNSK